MEGVEVENLKPKKQGSLEYIVVIITFLIAAFLSIKVGMAMTQKMEIEAAQGIAAGGAESVSLFFDCLNRQLNDSSLSFVWNDNTKKSLMVGGFIWFIAVAYYYTSKRKYIAGKEYGTAEWGTRKEINSLFAENIKNKELKQAKQVRNLIGRFFARMEVYKACKKNANERKAIELDCLNRWKDEKLSESQQKQKKQVLTEYRKRKTEINKKTKQEMKADFCESWTPYNGRFVKTIF